MALHKPDLPAEALSFLFVEGGSLSRKKLASLLKCSPSELKTALEALSERLKGSGLSLVESDTEASLVVSKETSGSVESALKEELERDIGDAGLEVLAIVLYMGPSTRARIDYIRGVNSSSTLRNLLARGILERAGNPEDAREYLYRPTVEALAHLGVEKSTQLPEYDSIVRELAAFEQTSEPFSKEDDNTGPL
jgi:segregation and condensation protein B